MPASVAARRPAAMGDSDMDTLMAILKMCGAAVWIAFMLGALPAQDNRANYLENRVQDQEVRVQAQALQVARMEVKIEKITEQLAAIESYQHAALLGIVGLVGKYLFDGFIALTRIQRRKDE